MAGEIRRQEAGFRRIFEVGRETEGVVTRLVVTSSRRRAEYRFIANGRVFTGGASIVPQHWNDLRLAGPIAVRYLPSDPANNIPSWRIQLDPTALLLSAILLCPMGIGCGMAILVPLRKRRWYLAHGRAAPAVVTRVDKPRSRGRVYPIVHYEFRLWEGGTCQGSYEKRDPIQTPEGALICVLYDPDHPCRHVRYQAGLPLFKVAADLHG